MRPRSRVARLALLLAAAGAAYVIFEASIALIRLEQVERERDGWQRPADVIAALDLPPGGVAIDLGAGSGYFAVRLADAVGAAGRVVAVDVARQPLAFLWIRKALGRRWQIDEVLAAPDDPGLEPGSADAVLIVNTYHELTVPAATLRAVRAALKPGGRLVVVDRRPRAGPGESPAAERANHELSPGTAEAEIRAAGFTTLHRDDDFIVRQNGEPWWMMVFTGSG
jgi:predicted methyltransferase